MGTIIAALIAAAGTVIGVTLSNSATEQANQEGLRLANIRRQDELRLQEKNEKLSKAKLRLDKRRLTYEREAELYGRAERAEERGYTRRERQFEKQMGIINRNDAMRNQLVNIWRR